MKKAVRIEFLAAFFPLGLLGFENQTGQSFLKNPQKYPI